MEAGERRGGGGSGRWWKRKGREKEKVETEV